MLTLTVNGHTHDVETDTATPLLYVLRDDLGLIGARFGCGLGQCGACTVLIDDKPVLSCITPAVVAVGRRITTIEGLGTADNPSGMIMRAEALLRRSPSPSEKEIREHMTPNLCRCGTHMRILAAVRRAAGGVKSAAAASPSPEASR